MSDNNSDETPETYYRRRGAGDGSVPPVPPLPPLPGAEKSGDESPWAAPAEAEPSPWAPPAPPVESEPIVADEVPDGDVGDDAETTTLTRRRAVDPIVDEPDLDDTVMSVRQVFDEGVNSRDVSTPLPEADFSAKSTGWSAHATADDASGAGTTTDVPVAEPHATMPAPSAAPPAVYGWSTEAPPSSSPWETAGTEMSAADVPAWQSAPAPSAAETSPSGWSTSNPLEPEARDEKPKNRARALLLGIGIPVVAVAALVAALFALNILPFGAADADKDPQPTTSASPTEVAPAIENAYPLGEPFELSETPTWVIEPLAGWEANPQPALKWTQLFNADKTCELATVSGNPTSANKVPSSFDNADQLGDSILRFLPAYQQNPGSSAEVIGKPESVIVPDADGTGVEMIRYEIKVTTAQLATVGYVVYARSWEPSDSLQFMRFSCTGESALTDTKLQQQILDSLSFEFAK